MVKVLLVGAGAVGVYFAGRLAAIGNFDVTVAARSDYDKVKVSGYAVKSIHGDFAWHPNVVKDAADFGGAADYIIITTKALPWVDVPALIRPAVGKHTVLVLIQNGIDGERELMEVFPGNEIISGIAYIGVTRTAPGEILHEGGGRLTLGVYPAGASPALTTLCNGFMAATGVECSATDDIELMRWGKLLWNLAFNPMSVLANGCDTQEMIADPRLESTSFRIMKEVQATARAWGKELSDEQLEHNMQYTRDFPAYKTSMLQDFKNKRPLETEAIVGNVVRRANAQNIPVPTIETIYALLHAADRMNRGEW